MNWTRVTRQNRCPICDHDHWCAFTGDGRSVKCMRIESAKPTSDGGWMHNLSGDVAIAENPRQRGKRHDNPVLPMGLAAQMLSNWRYQQNGQLEPFAATLGVSRMALESLGCVWAADHRAFAFPMRDGQGSVIGIRLRNDRGDKWAVKGSKSGLFMNFSRATSSVQADGDKRTMAATVAEGTAPKPVQVNAGASAGRPNSGNEIPRTLLIVEGPTDAAAAIDLGFAVIGRPACLGCEDMIARVARFNHGLVFIISDADAQICKPCKGKGCNGCRFTGILRPGLRGAERLQAKLPRAKIVTLPCKDLRAFKNSGGTKEILNALLTAVV